MKGKMYLEIICFIKNRKKVFFTKKLFKFRKDQLKNEWIIRRRREKNVYKYERRIQISVYKETSKTYFLNKNNENE